MRRLARSPKRNKRKVVSGSRVTLPENFAYKPELSFNPLARVTLALGSSSFHVNRALVYGQDRRDLFKLLNFLETEDTLEQDIGNRGFSREIVT